MDSNAFINYFEELPFQTIQMSNKQVLILETPESDQFASINRSVSSFVDERYFRTVMKEDKDSAYSKNYPIKMTALRADWLMAEQGKKFLSKLVQSENDDLFECHTTRVFIEFLYKHYKTSILKEKLPRYILQLFTYFASVLLSR